MTESPTTEERDVPSRRGFLGWLIGGIVGFIGSALGLPWVGALLSAGGGEQKELTIRLGKLTDYPEGKPALAQFTITRTDGWLQTQEGRSVWIVHHGAEDVTVYNGRCTHLGCAYSWRTEGANKDQFVCPCHDGIYALDGSVVSGPPPRPLDVLPARVEDGELVITFQDFRPGILNKTPA